MDKTEYFNCGGCGRAFKRNDPFEERFFASHDCDVTDAVFDHDYASARAEYDRAHDAIELIPEPDRSAEAEAYECTYTGAPDECNVCWPHRAHDGELCPKCNVWELGANLGCKLL